MVFCHLVQRVTIIGDGALHNSHQRIAFGKNARCIGVRVVGQRCAVVRLLRRAAGNRDRVRVRFDHQAVILDGKDQRIEVRIVIGEVRCKDTHLVTAHVSALCYGILLAAGIVEVGDSVKSIADGYQVIAVYALLIAVVCGLAAMFLHSHFHTGQRVHSQGVNHRVAGADVQDVILQRVGERVGHLAGIGDARRIGDGQRIVGRQHKHSVVHNACSRNKHIVELDGIVLVVVGFAIVSPGLAQRGDLQRQRYGVDLDGAVHHAHSGSIVIGRIPYRVAEGVVVRGILGIQCDACRVRDGERVAGRQLELRAVGGYARHINTIIGHRVAREAVRSAIISELAVAGSDDNLHSVLNDHLLEVVTHSVVADTVAGGEICGDVRTGIVGIGIDIRTRACHSTCRDGGTVLQARDVPAVMGGGVVAHKCRAVIHLRGIQLDGQRRWRDLLLEVIHHIVVVDAVVRLELHRHSGDIRHCGVDVGRHSVFTARHLTAQLGVVLQTADDVAVGLAIRGFGQFAHERRAVIFLGGIQLDGQVGFVDRQVSRVVGNIVIARYIYAASLDNSIARHDYVRVSTLFRLEANQRDARQRIARDKRTHCHIAVEACGVSTLRSLG